MRSISLAIALLLPCPLAAAQLLDTPTLRADLNTHPANLDFFPNVGPYVLADNGSELLFGAVELLDPRLWITDGTPAGTEELFRSPGGERIERPTSAAALSDGRFLVGADVFGFGAELVLVDPAGPTATLVTDLAAGPLSSFPDELITWSGEVWFVANDGNGDRALYRSDATALGTTLVFVLGSGQAAVQLAADSGALFLTLDDETGSGIYVLASPAGSPVLLKAGTPWMELGTDLQSMAVGSTFYFAMDEGSGRGIEPWVSDGTPQGTFELADLNPGSGSSSPRFLAHYGSGVLMSANPGSFAPRPYATDGTSAGTVLLTDAASGFAPTVSSADAVSTPFGFVFIGNMDPTGNEPWLTDLTSTGTGLITELLPGAQSRLLEGLVEFGGLVYIHMREIPGAFLGSAADSVLYSTDGTAAGTGIAVNQFPADSTFDLLPDRAMPWGMFASGLTSLGLEPFATDGTPSGTSSLALTQTAPVTDSSLPQGLLRFRDRVVLGTPANGSSSELFSLSPMSQAASVLEVGPSGWNDSVLGGALALEEGFLYRTLSNATTELWFSSGAPGSAELIATGAIGGQMVEWNGEGYFAKAGALWKTDGSAGGTVAMTGASIQDVGSIVKFADSVWFSAWQSGVGFELFRLDGSAAGASVAVEFLPGIQSGLPHERIDGAVAGDRLFLQALLPGGVEIVAVDPSGSFTSLDSVVAPGVSTGMLETWAVLNDTFLFALERLDGSAIGVFASDGTLAGTESLVPAAAGSYELPGDFSWRWILSAGSVAYFWTIGAGQVGTCWKTSGTQASTSSVGSTNVAWVSGIGALGSGGQAAFAVAEAVDTWRPYLASDQAGSLAPIAPVLPYPTIYGPLGQLGFESARLGDELIFVGSEIEFGVEPHALPIVELGGFVAESFGSGCGDAAIGLSGEARIGETVAVTLTDAPSQSLAWLYGGFEQAFSSLSVGCHAHLGLAAFLGSVQTDVQGASAISFAVPQLPGLAGVTFFAQWAIDAPGGPLLGVLELSDGLEIVLGT